MAPRSRGASAVARAAAAPPAAEQAIDPEDKVPPREDREGVVEIPLEGYTPILDLKGLCGGATAIIPLASPAGEKNCTRCTLCGAICHRRGCGTRMEARRVSLL
eukprot:4796857-Pleurochrysis_carterae.AAC.1